MTTTVYFLDGKLEYSDPKTARGKLRKMGLSVRDARKAGDDYHFDIGKPSGAVSGKVIARPSKPKASIPVLQTIVRETKEIPKLETTGEQIIVEGRDLKAHDVLINFIPMVDLTIDHRGVGEIVVKAPNITRVTNRFNGFFSLESGNVSSYLIDPSREYLVSRRDWNYNLKLGT